jgi:hypothetical protein
MVFSMTEPKHLEFRAAGQAMVGLLLGVWIVGINAGGIAVGDHSGPELPEDGSVSPDKIREQLAILLGGIAAVECYASSTPLFIGAVERVDIDRDQLDVIRRANLMLWTGPAPSER